MRQHYGGMCYSGHDITIDEFTSACASGEYTLIKNLLDKGLPPQIGRHSSLIVAINCDAILKNKADDKSIRFEALLTACAHRMVSVVEGILDGSVHVNKRLSGMTPLLRAVNKSDPSVEVIKCLLARGAGETPLHTAIRQDHADVVELLFQSGADIHAELGFNVAPILVAAGRGHCSVVGLMVRHEVSLRDANHLGHSILKMSILCSQLEMLKHLVVLGFLDLDYRDSAGGTALLYAASYNRYEMIKVLVDAGCDVNMTDVHGRGPLDHLRMQSPSGGPREIEKLLQGKKQRWRCSTQ
ncbi:ankyrin repeat domain-containing protein [Aspergillus stella-maris]|uniref:ankyrin repeat domain-containing protein n=1 Tax=Aspergillus stella-maris TaxID=1810926 RepID=UPI003CCC93C3